jgi:hypothetical protein
VERKSGCKPSERTNTGGRSPMCFCRMEPASITCWSEKPPRTQGREQDGCRAWDRVEGPHRALSLSRKRGTFKRVPQPARRFSDQWLPTYQPSSCASKLLSRSGSRFHPLLGFSSELAAVRWVLDGRCEIEFFSLRTEDGTTLQEIIERPSSTE